MGVGTGDAQELLDEMYVQKGYEDVPLGFDAHNQYLQQWIETGLPGLFVLLILLFISAKVAWKHKSWPYICLLTIVLVVACTESLFESNKGIVWFSFFSCMIYSNLRQIGYAQENINAAQQV